MMKKPSVFLPHMVFPKRGGKCTKRHLEKRLGAIERHYLRLDAEVGQSVADLDAELLVALRDRDGARAVAVLQNRMNQDADVLREMVRAARRTVSTWGMRASP